MQGQVERDREKGRARVREKESCHKLIQLKPNGRTYCTLQDSAGQGEGQGEGEKEGHCQDGGDGNGLREMERVRDSGKFEDSDKV